MRKPSRASFSLLIYPDVVHQHGLRKLGGSVGIARPLAAHRHIQQDEERVIVDPLGIFWNVARCPGGIKMVVDVETDGFRLPLDGIDVEIVGEAGVVGKSERCAGPLAAAISGAVNRAVHERGLLADVFHDVDLAAVWPASLFDVITHHPKRGPDALSPGDFDASFEASEFLRELTLGLQASRGVVASYAIGAGKFFLKDFDDKIAALMEGVFRAGGIELEFLVAP